MNKQKGNEKSSFQGAAIVVSDQQVEIFPKNKK